MPCSLYYLAAQRRGGTWHAPRTFICTNCRNCLHCTNHHFSTRKEVFWFLLTLKCVGTEGTLWDDCKCRPWHFHVNVCPLGAKCGIYTGNCLAHACNLIDHWVYDTKSSSTIRHEVFIKSVSTDQMHTQYPVLINLNRGKLSVGFLWAHSHINFRHD